MSIFSKCHVRLSWRRFFGTFLFWVMSWWERLHKELITVQTIFPHPRVCKIVIFMTWAWATTMNVFWQCTCASSWFITLNFHVVELHDSSYTKSLVWLIKIYSSVVLNDLAVTKASVHMCWSFYWISQSMYEHKCGTKNPLLTNY